MQQLFLRSTITGAMVALGVLLGSPALAQIRQITGVNIAPNENGALLNLTIEQAQQSTILPTQFGNTAVFDLTVTQLIEGVGFVQNQPIEGIEQIAVEPLDANSVRIRIVGVFGVPTVAVSQDQTGIVLTVVPARPQRSIACQYCPRPDYPESAREAGIEGSVKLTVFYNAQGAVTDVRLAQSSGHESLDLAALEAARNYVFEVEGSNGQGGSITIEIQFAVDP